MSVIARGQCCCCPNKAKSKPAQRNGDEGNKIITTMSDNKLRCVLVYRLQRTKTTSADSSSSGGGGVDGIALTNLSPGPVTLLAKYDHASEYESHEGSAAGGLYGDREKNYADAVAMVISGDPPRGITEENTIGGFKIVQSDMHQVIYGADSRGLCEFDFA